MIENTNSNTHYIMIALVSDQTTQNIVPIFHPNAPNFTKMFLLYTGTRYEGQLTATQETIQLRFPTMSFETKLLTNAGSEATFTAVEAIIKDVNSGLQSSTEKVIVVCNWTGGTKPMSKGMLDAVEKYSSNYDCRTIYVDTENKKIIDPQKVYSDPVINLQLSIREYLYAHSVRPIETKESSRTNIDWVKASELLWKALNSSYKEQFRYANPIETEKMGAITKLFITSYIREAEDLAEKLKDLGVVTQWFSPTNAKLLELQPTPGGARKFLEGGWLEYYVYGELVKKYCQNSLTGIDGKLAQSLELKWKNTKVAQSAQKLKVANELDVVLVEGVRMTVISCKIGGGFRIGLADKDKVSTNEPIYELEAIVRSFGLFSSKILVVAQSKSQLRESLEQRADVFGIKVFTFEDLPHIADKVASVIGR